MKKITKLCLVALLLISGIISGCGNNSENKEDEKQEEKQEDKQEEVSVDEVLGKVENNKYVNKYAEIAYEFDDNWYVQDNQDIDNEAHNEIADNAMEGTDLEEAGENAQQIRDVFARDEDGSNFNVLLSKKVEEDKKNYEKMSEKQIIEASLLHTDALIEAYENVGFENVEIESYDVMFLGEKHTGMKTTAEYQGYSMYIVQVMLFDKGDYDVTITVTSDSLETAESIFANFKKA